MEKILATLLLLLTVLVTGCSINESKTVTDDQSLSAGLISSSQSSPNSTSQTTNQSSETVTQSATDASSTSSVLQSSQNTPESAPIENDSRSEPTKEDTMKTLVVYFSCTNTTKTLAEYAADILGADIYEIVPAEPYTEADLAYYTNGRADQEQNDPSVRPEISGGVDNMSEYDTIILGYPIWHGQAPRIISTFLESYDFSGKTIVPFCTSHSSGMGSSADNLHTLCAANWLNGKRFGGETTQNELENWLKQYNIS